MLRRSTTKHENHQRIPQGEGRQAWGGLWMREPTPSLSATPPGRGFSWELSCHVAAPSWMKYFP
jgi:hypothetical protein